MSYHCSINGDVRMMAGEFDRATDYIIRALRERAKDHDLSNNKSLAYAHIEAIICVGMLTEDMNFCTTLDKRTYSIEWKGRS